VKMDREWYRFRLKMIDVSRSLYSRCRREFRVKRARIKVIILINLIIGAY
jgi:hypothetical protein